MMSKKELSVNLSNGSVSQDQILTYAPRLAEAQLRLDSGKEDFTGWVKLPLTYDRAEVIRIIQTAVKIRKQCEAFVVVGIGGSYLGARAAIEMLTGPLTPGWSGFLALNGLVCFMHIENKCKLSFRIVAIPFSFRDKPP